MTYYLIYVVISHHTATAFCVSICNIVIMSCYFHGLAHRCQNRIIYVSRDLLAFLFVKVVVTPLLQSLIYNAMFHR